MNDFLFPLSTLYRLSSTIYVLAMLLSEGMNNRPTWWWTGRGGILGQFLFSCDMVLDSVMVVQATNCHPLSFVDWGVWINIHAINESAGGMIWSNLNQIISTMYVKNSLIKINFPIKMFGLWRFSKIQGLIFFTLRVSDQNRLEHEGLKKIDSGNNKNGPKKSQVSFIGLWG